MLTTTYELDIVPGGVPQVITASQYDANSRSLAFNLYSSTGNLSLPSGTHAAIRGTKPDGNGFDYDATITGTTVTFTVTEQMTAIAGRVMCEIYLYSGTAGSSSYKQIATANFILYVERAAMDKDTLISGSEIRQLVDIMDNSGEIIAAASLAATSAANAAQSATDAAGTLAAATTTIHNERDAAISAVNTSKTAAIEEAEAAYEQQLESLLAVKSDADETVEAMQASTAPLFDATATYDAGDYCIYDADLYRCIAPVLTAGAWDASHWERTTFSDELSDMGAQVFDALHYATVSGNPLEITGTLNTLPARQVDIDIAPIQNLHGYGRAWPAGCGSNLWPEYTTETKSGVTLTNDGGKVTINGGNESSDVWFDINVSYAVAANQAIHIGAFNPAASTNRLSLFVITSSGNPQINLNTANAVTSDTSASERTITKLRLRVPSGETYTNFVLYPYMQIGGDAPTAWSPYSNVCPIGGVTNTTLTVKPDASSAGTAHTIAFPAAAGTVYGGTLDVTNGILKVTWAREIFTWGTYKGTETSGDYTRRLFYLSAAPDYSKIAGAISSIGPNSNSSTYDPPHIRCVRSGSMDYCYIYMPSTTDDSTTIQVAYPLATPIAYSVTAHEIRMFEDYTLLTTDAANITAEVYVNQIEYNMGYTNAAIADAEHAVIAAEYASTTYTAGDYCMHEGRMYRCTTDIDTAEAWTAAHWELVTVSGAIATDDTLSVAGRAADAAAVSSALNGRVAVQQGVASAGKALVVGNDGAVTIGDAGIPDAVKSALLNIFRHVAYIDDQGQHYYDALEAALGLSPVSITAVYNPYDTVIVGDSLERLHGNLTVTATYVGGATEQVQNFTLSGSVVEGTNTLTITYKGISTTVTVTAVALPAGYTRVSAVVTDGTQYINSGLNETHIAGLGVVYKARRTDELQNGSGHILSAKAYFTPYAQYRTSTDGNMRTLFANRFGNSDVPAPIDWTVNEDMLFEAYLNGSDNVYCNGELKFSLQVGDTAPASGNALIFFGYGDKPTASRFRFVGKFYFLQLYNGSTLVHNYLPMLNASSVAGLYDTVTGSFLAPTGGTLAYEA